MQVSFSRPVRFAASSRSPFERAEAQSPSSTVADTTPPGQDRVQLKKSKAYRYPAPSLRLQLTPELAQGPSPTLREFLRLFINKMGAGANLSESAILTVAQERPKGLPLQYPISDRTYEQLSELKSGGLLSTSALSRVGMNRINIALFQFNDQLLEWIDDLIENADQRTIGPLGQKPLQAHRQEVQQLKDFLAERGFTEKALSMLGVTSDLPDLLDTINDLLYARPVKELKAIRDHGNVFESLQNTCFQLTELRNRGVMTPEIWRKWKRESDLNTIREALSIHGGLMAMQEQDYLTPEQAEVFKEMTYGERLEKGQALYQQLIERKEQYLEELEGKFQTRASKFEKLSNAVKTVEAMDELFPDQLIPTTIRQWPNPVMEEMIAGDEASKSTLEYLEHMHRFLEKTLLPKLDLLLPLIQLTMPEQPIEEAPLSLNSENPPRLLDDEIAYNDRQKKFRKTFRHYRLPTGEDAYQDRETGDWHYGLHLTPDRVMQTLKRMHYESKGKVGQKLHEWGEKMHLNDGLSVAPGQRIPVASGDSFLHWSLPSGEQRPALPPTQETRHEDD